MYLVNTSKMDGIRIVHKGNFRYIRKVEQQIFYIAKI